MRRTLFILAALLPLTLTHAFAAGDPEAGKQKSQACVTCHGANGNSSNPMWPKLAGQHADYIVTQLKAYKSGSRENAVMYGIAATLSEQDMEDLATYYSNQSLRGGATEPALRELGETIYRAGNAETNVPACMACHSPTGMGNPLANYPRLSGQHAEYTAIQLRYFRDKIRINEVMNSAVQRITDEEIEAVSSYIEGLRSNIE